MANYEDLVHGFFDLLVGDEIEIYNEFSLQHELGIYLRQKTPKGQKVQFERPFEYFGITGQEYAKKEIDIVVFSADPIDSLAIETKFPRNGRYPESMFDACKDIQFLEQLVEGGFGSGLFVMAVDDPLFYSGEKQDGIYGPFRGVSPLHGFIPKPTGKKDESVEIKGSYRISWRNLEGSLSYIVVSVSPKQDRS